MYRARQQSVVKKNPSCNSKTKNILSPLERTKVDYNKYGCANAFLYHESYFAHSNLTVKRLWIALF